MVNLSFKKISCRHCLIFKILVAAKYVVQCAKYLKTNKRCAKSKDSSKNRAKGKSLNKLKESEICENACIQVKPYIIICE